MSENHQNSQSTKHEISSNDDNKLKEDKPQSEVQEEFDSKDAEDKISEYSDEIPEHFYDSDMASVCEQDFQSDNEPPKDIVQERKLLFKQKFLHVFKTIIRVGQGIDKPARYDRIILQHQQIPKEQIKKYYSKNSCKARNQKEVQSKDLDKEEQEQEKQIDKKQEKEIVLEESKLVKKSKEDSTKSEKAPQTIQYPPFFSTEYLDDTAKIEYNLGNENQEIERLVTSMKRGQTAVFELEHLETSKKSNIKVKRSTEVHLIHVDDWTTVIDLDGDKKYLKYMLQRGEGAFRVSLYDQITFKYRILRKGLQVESKSYESERLEKDMVQKGMPALVWRVLESMKNQESVKLTVGDQDLQEIESEETYSRLSSAFDKFSSDHNVSEVQKEQSGKQNQFNSDAEPIPWEIFISISELHKVDDIYLDGRLLKKTIVKGVSTAKPESSSLVYYALKFISAEGQQTLKSDKCFEGDWWEDFGKLDKLCQIRKSYLDDYSISRMLKTVIKRMKPAEIAHIECRDKEMFRFGADFEELKQLWGFQDDTVPEKVVLVVRVFNFTEARTAFNLELGEKIQESKRKKAIAIRLLKEDKIKKALKRFSNIVALYSSEKIDQESYDEKISALMNSVLCHMKSKNYQEMIRLCNEILEKPRHGHQIEDLEINGPGYVKVEGSVPDPQSEEAADSSKGKDDRRRIAHDLKQNPKIIDKCLYRKAYALVQTGECEQALKVLQKISEEESSQNQQVIKLKEQAQKGNKKYQDKSKKIFKSMFG